MGAPRVYRTEAVVLRRHNLGEADKILTLLTPTYGLVRAVAKGVRRPKAKLAGHLDLLCRSDLLIAKGLNLDVVTGAALIDGYAPLRDHLYLGSCAIYCLEVSERFSH
ncbi:MAG: DNA repair protein RecO, partial [Dehalococcoidia bacterium]|nr:DNA repair protein RecO [Dehalococcoidia bacterium]